MQKFALSTLLVSLYTIAGVRVTDESRWPGRGPTKHDPPRHIAGASDPTSRGHGACRARAGLRPMKSRAAGGWQSS